ncbi:MULTISPECIES: hypothetical protein [Actinomadura]|uniref:Uncharacterized protein n=1 Tax=Actinomadura yumaensis TaxID=111807 RepID=A0ABW2CQX8_9ACTN|nr:hypothetical protein [Actinomadura sp. J1-007]
MDRKRLGLLAVAFVLIVGVMEILALRLGSLEFPVQDGKADRSAVADHPDGT